MYNIKEPPSKITCLNPWEKNTNNGKKSYFSFSPNTVTMNINITSSICDLTQMILTENIKVDIVRPHSNIEVDNVATMWRIG